MNPCQEFRLWARRAPTAERVSAGVAAIIVFILLVWLVAPGGGTNTQQLASGGGSSAAGAAAGSDNGAGAAGAATGGSAGSTGGGAAGGATQANGAKAGAAAGPGAAAGTAGVAPGCPPTVSGVPGVSNSQVKIAVTLTNIVGPAANSIFGIAPPAQQQAWYQAQIDEINKAGGVGCRKIVPTFYPTNPADQNELQQR